ncbi:hypothetical protein GALMADRAFT_155787 [Galerina marginata CBS 339.88]|uniref:Uncharacterized protein n=1 Tax=Galerina marginata (strain CBS 339.88) TaxID=685588 RepID=A0A067T1X2_GALM3|nr:hypothetical protein GALMADRAFT_155787 [Galerina marginata CBS 339.88]
MNQPQVIGSIGAKETQKPSDVLPASSSSPSCLVGTICGFLNTRQHLAACSSNVSLIGLIKEAQGEKELQPEAEEILLSRDSRRNRTRLFVSLMDWAPMISNEAAGLGLSDRSMDFFSTDRNGSDREALRLLKSALGDAQDLFCGSIAPVLTIGQNPSVRFQEPLYWAARHWVHAGKPTINSSQALYAMKRAELVPDDTACLFKPT